MYKTRIKEKWWFSQCGRTWLVCRKQLNTSGVTLNEPQTHHQTPMTCTFIIWTKVLGHPLLYKRKGHCQTVPTKMETYFMHLEIVFPPLLQQFWNDCTHMSLVFGDEFLAQGLHLKSHQRCSAAFCRPVKFFHTDWIIISLWFLSYTQRHGHVRIEKGSVQTVAIEAHNSLKYHYMLKH